MIVLTCSLGFILLIFGTGIVLYILNISVTVLNYKYKLILGGTNSRYKYYTLQGVTNFNFVKQVNSNSVRRCTLISRSGHGEVVRNVYNFIGNLKGTTVKKLGVGGRIILEYILKK
jgi:hypothetical protein